MGLKKQCEEQLSNARLKVEKITANDDGNISTEEFNYDS
jgi:exonuclease VII small subunit